MSQPYVFCDHTFSLINLLTTSREVNVDENYESRSATVDNFDLYGSRMNEKKWCNENDFLAHLSGLETMPLIDFAKQFKAVKGKIGVALGSKPRCPVFSPDINSVNPKHPDYWKYCLVSLLKYKPWLNQKQCVYNGESALQLDLKDVSVPEKEKIL